MIYQYTPFYRNNSTCYYTDTFYVVCYLVYSRPLYYSLFFFFLMIRRPPRSTHCISSAASDVYKRQVSTQSTWVGSGYQMYGIGKSENDQFKLNHSGLTAQAYFTWSPPTILFDPLNWIRGRTGLQHIG
eukprot:TRINITY_DN1738_c0_g1_i1.p2 TRINITY_DN1738_c0_g1~~TRINITY_DN1738_c0_g1_i1.p2  ORF type:complete len:129 (+),score=19.97 TRINITY_DN1738_c0_g1_i1:2-388(+)